MSINNLYSALVNDAITAGDRAAPINYDRRGHAVEILVECSDFFPVGNDERSLCTAKGACRCVHIFDVGEVCSNVLARDRVVDDDLGTTQFGFLDYRGGSRVANIVGSWLERKT